MKNINSKFRLKHVLRDTFSFFGRNMKWIAFLFFFISTAYCIYIWYGYVYKPGWSEQRKQDYINSKDKAVTFSRPKFREIVEDGQNRKKVFSEDLKKMQDIFRLEQ